MVTVIIQSLTIQNIKSMLNSKIYIYQGKSILFLMYLCLICILPLTMIIKQKKKHILKTIIIFTNLQLKKRMAVSDLFLRPRSLRLIYRVYTSIFILPHSLSFRHSDWLRDLVLSTSPSKYTPLGSMHKLFFLAQLARLF